MMRYVREDHPVAHRCQGLDPGFLAKTVLFLELVRIPTGSIDAILIPKGSSQCAIDPVRPPSAGRINGTTII